jgi:poly-gamma-glutamate synthase PgsB/CapB
VPLRIAVTGTRGKTSVTRRLAAVLSESGRKVLAKTTGSEAAYLLPDGTVQEIHRVGAPSIIEQKHLLRRGAKLGVDVVLAEVMSVRQENHQVEIHGILRPHVVLVTNFRVDHVEAQGKTREEVASVLALDVPPGARVLVPAGELEETFRERVREVGAELEMVPEGEAILPARCLPSGGTGEFGPNLDLVWAAARSLGVSEDSIRDGICKAQDDVGALRSWRFAPEGADGSWILVNAFAANDPDSTLGIYDRITTAEDLPPELCTGLLSLRSDRGDRSLQWADTLEAGGLSRFRTLFVFGLHGPALRHRLRHHPHAGRIRLLPPGPPEEVMECILAGDAPLSGTRPRLLFGFGNMFGLGRELVRHWRKVGEPHGI